MKPVPAKKPKTVHPNAPVENPPDPDLELARYLFAGVIEPKALSCRRCLREVVLSEATTVRMEPKEYKSQAVLVLDCPDCGELIARRTIRWREVAEAKMNEPWKKGKR